MGKYFTPILPGPSSATNQNTVPGPPIQVKLAKTLYHTGSDRIQMDIVLITCPKGTKSRGT
jgi:hypothetical protein